MEDRFTLVSLDAYTGDYVEVALFGARGAELARESLYEDEYTSPAMETVRGERCVLLKFGELALKGRNRPLFVNALERNLRRLTSDLGPLEVRHRGGVLIVTGDDAGGRACGALPARCRA